MSYGKSIKFLRKQRGWTQAELARKVNVSPQVVSNWEREYSGLDENDISKLSEVFVVPSDVVLGKIDHVKESPLPYGASPYEPDKMVRLPILGTIRAGEPINMERNIEGYELVEPELLRGRKGFVLRVKGDSMSGDRILEGDLVICIAQEEASPSDIAVVAINGEEATLKRVKCQEDMCILSPSNPAYEPLLVPAKDVHIIGVVEEVKFRPKRS